MKVTNATETVCHTLCAIPVQMFASPDGTTGTGVPSVGYEGEY